ncbi:hypothetical protein CRG98_003413 [Punica granatum]|uniref:Uncharacterized protein n=1 Tax=Punica granatum TaxID=22663 RepID=A0A2I0L7U1_PUNGR|nr:hypothetical protein CRG98_003413 [Punica granatum]
MASGDSFSRASVARPWEVIDYETVHLVATQMTVLGHFKDHLQEVLLLFRSFPFLHYLQDQLPNFLLELPYCLFALRKEGA